MGKAVGNRSKPSRTSPFRQITTSLYLPLSPCAYNFPAEGLCAEHISPHLLSYYPPLHGVLLSYSNPRLSEGPEEAAEPGYAPANVLTQSIAEYAVSFVWLTAEFLVFRPEKGTTLEGEVNLQSESVLGVMCYNYFNAAIEKGNLPEGWTWDGETWLDADGNPAQGSLTFKVEDFEASGGQDGISIMGSLR